MRVIKHTKLLSDYLGILGGTLLHIVRPVILEFFNVEIGQFNIAWDEFANISVRFKKAHPTFFVAIQNAILNLKKQTAI